MFQIILQVSTNNKRHSKLMFDLFVFKHIKLKIRYIMFICKIDHKSTNVNKKSKIFVTNCNSISRWICLIFLRLHSNNLINHRFFSIKSFVIW